MPQIAGGCRCGEVRYSLELETLPATYACHCRDCQTWTGSAFSQQTILPQDSLSVSGPITVFELTTPSGRVSKQYVCSVCHTRIYNTNSARPGDVIVRAGTLDDSDRLDVVAHIWVARKQPWLSLPRSVPKWPQAAPPKELAKALVQKRRDA